MLSWVFYTSWVVCVHGYFTREQAFRQAGRIQIKYTHSALGEMNVIVFPL